MAQAQKKSGGSLHKVAFLLIILAVIATGVYIYSSRIEPANVQRIKPIIPAPTWDLTKFNSGQNPYRHYETALAYVSGADSETLANYLAQQRTNYRDEDRVTQEQYQTALKNTQPAIPEVLLGASCSIKNYVFPEKPASAEALFPEFAQLRGLARVVVADAADKAQQGKISASANELLALMEMGNDVSTGPSMIGYLVGVAVKSIAARPLMDLLNAPKITARDYRQIAKELGRINFERPTLRQALESEYHFCRGSVLEILNYDSKRLNEVMTGDSESSSGTKLSAAYLAIPGMKSRTVRNFDKAWQAMLANCDKPYAEAMQFDVRKHVPKNDIINRMLLPAFNGVRAKDAQDAAVIRGLMLVAALQAYRLEHGNCPATLQDLVDKGYISRVPFDPYANNQAFKYTRRTDGYLLYSIGADMTDDGGKIVKPFYQIGSDQQGKLIRGDIVFAPGLDIWSKPPKKRHP